MAAGPIDHDALLVAAAKASVAGERLPGLVDRADRHLADRLSAYRRRYECVHEDDDHAVFLVEQGHWRDRADDLGFDEREADAVARTHGEHLKRLGTELDRREEFESALELREVVAISKDGEE